MSSLPTGEDVTSATSLSQTFLLAGHGGSHHALVLVLILVLWEAEVGGSPGQEFETILTTWWNPVSTKNTKIS